jgi:hypothetical protein
MASYLPAQRSGSIWQTEYDKLHAPPPIRFPGVSSGSRRDYSGRPSGTPEFDLPNLGKAAGDLKHQVRNVLLYGHGWGGVGGALEKQPNKGPATPVGPSVLATNPTPTPYAFDSRVVRRTPLTDLPKSTPSVPGQRAPWMSPQDVAQAGTRRAPWTETASSGVGRVGGNPLALEAAGRDIPLSARLNTTQQSAFNPLDAPLVPRTLSRTQKRPAGMNTARARSIFTEE